MDLKEIRLIDYQGSLTFIWVYASLCSLMPLLSKNQFVFEGFRTSCTFDYVSRDGMPRATIITLTIFGFAIPFLVIVVFYSLIWNILTSKSQITTHYLFKYELRNRKNMVNTSSSNALCHARDVHTPSPLDNTTVVNDGDTIVSYNHNRMNEIPLESIHKWRKTNDDSIKISRITKFGLENDTNGNQSFTFREIRVAKTILLIVALFIISWTPYVMIAFFAQFAPVSLVPSIVTPYTAALPAIFAKASSIFNPIVFTLTNRECYCYFKRALNGITWIKRLFPRRPRKPQQRLLKPRNKNRR